jgi:ABC-type Zn uptake system ZnuABC Zn-binding protein ZnuA
VLFKQLNGILMIQRIFICLFILFSAQVLAKKTSIVCTHPQVCNIISTIVDLDSVNLSIGVKPLADPHDHELSSKEIKTLTKADIVAGPGVDLQSWLRNIKRKRKSPTLVYTSTHINRSHFWLYPNEVCSAFNFYKKELKKLVKIKEDLINCNNQDIEIKLKSSLEKFKNKIIILTHNASEELFKSHGISTISLKTSGHHDEVSAYALKKLYKAQKKHTEKDIVWILEKGIHIPSSILSKIRKDEKVIKLDVLGSFNKDSKQVLSTLIDAINGSTK